jgi:hypothetical protein
MCDMYFPLEILIEIAKWNWGAWIILYSCCKKIHIMLPDLSPFSRFLRLYYNTSNNRYECFVDDSKIIYSLEYSKLKPYINDIWFIRLRLYGSELFRFQVYVQASFTDYKTYVMNTYKNSGSEHKIETKYMFPIGETNRELQQRCVDCFNAEMVKVYSCDIKASLSHFAICV